MSNVSSKRHRLIPGGYRLYAREACRVLDEFHRWYGFTPEDLQRAQTEKLRALLSIAQRSPFHRERLERAGVIASSGAVRVDRFHEIPVLTKDEIRVAGRSLLTTSDSSSFVWAYSGGTTGQPVPIAHPKPYWRSVARAAAMLFDEWSGFQLGDRKVVMWGDDREILVGRRGISFAVKRLLKRELFINTFKLRAGDVPRIVDLVNRYQPQQILGYVESLVFVARVARSRRLSIAPVPAVMTTAGSLTPSARRDLEGFFGAPVFNRYGSREMTGVASEDKRGEGLCVLAPLHYLEVLRPDGTPAAHGEIGEVVITCLENPVMPLIRYRIGDTAATVASAHSISAWPRLKTVYGRTSDHLFSSEGVAVHGEYFTHLFYGVDWVIQFRVVQQADLSVVVSVVPVQGTPRSVISEAWNGLRGAMATVLGREVRIDMEIVDHIPRSPSGKLRYVESLVRSGVADESA